ncbi:MAG: fimbrillin family protein [Alistipes sp.]|nr:fimbrillin family protein [Alistipes sp.]
MKKLLLAVVAMFAMIACNNEQAVLTKAPSAITFGDSFIEIKTRATAEDPSITTATIQNFDVWGFIETATGTVFDAERVTRGENGWSYENTQWWVPSKNYFFHAVSPVEKIDEGVIVINTTDMNTYGLGNIAFTNNAGDVDLLYTTKHVETGATEPYYNGKVSLQFMHLLSKIKFTFTNGFTNNNSSLAVKNIKISDAPAKGNIDVNKEYRQDFVWDITQDNSTVALNFGDVNGGQPIAVGASDESAKERLTISADATRSYTIEFDLELWYGNEKAMDSHKSVTLTGQAFEIGKNYNITAIINNENFTEEALAPIIFDVEKVEGWELGEHNGKIDFDNDGTQVNPGEPVALATPVVTAVAKENTVTLSWDAVENAASYSITVGTEMPVFVEETSYVFTGEYETEYTFNVVAVPADEEKFAASEAGVATATTEAAPAVTPETKTISVAEFLAMPEDEAEGAATYRLTGVITRMYRENNSNDTLYGNFYLKDATGEVLIYGLMDKDGNKYWATSGAKIGDTITVETVRTSYAGSPQGKNATFVELVPFVETASEWGVVGDLTNWGDNGNTPDIVMYNTWKAENLFVAYNVEIASGAFKIRANNEWNNAKNYGLSAAGKIYADKYYTLINGASSQNATPMVYGTYDVYFDLAKERIALVTPGKEYADAVEGGDPVVVIEGLADHEWGLVGSFNGWDIANYVVTEVQGDWAVAKNVTLTNGAEFKFAADKAWTLSYGSGSSISVGETINTFENGGNIKFSGEDGAYNVYFSLVDAKVYMAAYSAATTVTFNVADYNFANQEALASYTVGDVTIAFDGGGNNNSPKYYTSGAAVRCYPKNTITVSGKTIKKVEVVAPDGYTNAIDLYNDSTKLDNFTWEGSSENVVLTFDSNKTSGQSRFVKINVTYE